MTIGIDLCACRWVGPWRTSRLEEHFASTQRQGFIYVMTLCYIGSARLFLCYDVMLCWICYAWM